MAAATKARNARVAAGGLDDFGLFRDHAGLFRCLDHRPADSVLNAGKWVEELQFQQHRGVAGRDKPAQLYKRRIECGLDNVGIGLLRDMVFLSWIYV